MTSSFPLLALLVLLPALTGLTLYRGREPQGRRAWGVAVGVAGASFLLALGLAVATYGSQSGALYDPGFGLRHPLLGVDRVSAVLLPFVALIGLALLLGMPRRDLTPRAIGSLLLVEGLTLGLFTGQDLALLALFWVGALLPGYFRSTGSQRRQRDYQAFLLLCTAPFAVAVLLLALNGLQQRGYVDLNLARLGGADEGTMAHAAVALLAVSMLTRTALLPMHTRMLKLFERGPMDMAVFLAATRPSAYLLARVILPHFSSSGSWTLEALAVLGMATALVSSLATLVQRDLRRLLGFLSISQAGIIVIGLCAGDAESIAGALLQWMSIGLGMVGLTLCVRAVEVRAGLVDIAALGGVGQRLPRLGGAFLLFSVAFLGFPGTLGFVAEDLTVNGLLEGHPVLAAGIVLVTAFNGIALLRAYAHVFLGPERLRVSAGDLLPRERLVAVGLVAVLLGFGVLPARLLNTRSDFAAGLVRQR